MKINKLKISKIAILCMVVASTTSCGEDKIVKDKEIDKDGTKNKKSSYYVAVDVAADPSSQVLLAVDKLDSGVISAENNGVQQVSKNTSFFEAGNQVLAMGSVSDLGTRFYKFNGEGVTEKSGFTPETGVYAFTHTKDEFIFMSSPRKGFSKKKIYVLDAKTYGVKNSVDVSFGNREAEKIMSFPVDMILRDGKLFVAYYEASDDGKFRTPSAEKAKIAVFDFPSLAFNKIIEDTRMPNVGRYFSFNALEQDEKGDIYVYSPSSSWSGYLPVPKENSGILRIKKGSTDFDSSYHLDFEKISGGLKILDFKYLKDGKALVRYTEDKILNDKFLQGFDMYDFQMAAKTNPAIKAGIAMIADNSYYYAAYSPGSDSKLAGRLPAFVGFGIVDLNAKSFTKASNIPLGFGSFQLASLLDGDSVYVGASLGVKGSIYKIDLNTAEAVKGADIDVNYIKGIYKLVK